MRINAPHNTKNSQPNNHGICGIASGNRSGVIERELCVKVSATKPHAMYAVTAAKAMSNARPKTSATNRSQLGNTRYSASTRMCARSNNANAKPNATATPNA